jgi:hypothetical protein
MKIAKLFSFLAVLILGCAAAASAARKATPTKTDTKKASTTTNMAVHHMMGTVSSATDSDLVLEHEWKGKKEETKFALDSSTKKEGDITKGCHATVTYEMQNKERKATEVKVSAMKSPMKTKSATTAKKSS